MAKAAAYRLRWREPSVLPGFGLTFGFTIFYLSIIVLIPLAGLGWRSAALGWEEFWRLATDPRLLGALRTSFWTAGAAAAINELGPDAFDIVAPSLSILAEPPVAVVDANVDAKGTREVATAYLEYLYTPVGQNIAAKHYYRPSNRDGVDPAELERFPDLELVTIDDLGGWEKAQPQFFGDGGVFDQIYQPGR